MAQTIKVLDYIMSTGKSSYIFDFMNKHKEKKFMYISPLLSEAVTRALEAGAEIDLQTPTDFDTTKSESLLQLLREGRNISTTHSLFHDLTDDHISEIKYHKYVLIVDETVDFIESYNQYKREDIRDLYTRGDLTVDESNLGRVSMNWDVTNGAHFSRLKRNCDSGLIYATKDQPDTVLTIHLPPSMIRAASEVMVCTYMFDNSIMKSFLSLHGFAFEYIRTEALDKRQDYIKQQVKQNLNIITLKGFDKILSAHKKSSLSHSWWERSLKDGTALDIIKVCSNWLVNGGKKHKDSFYFTSPKALVKYESGTRGKPLLDRNKVKYFINTYNGDEESGVLPKWMYSGTKATNEYQDMTCCFYLMNIYPNVGISQYLQSYRHEIDSDGYALSEMIQLVWRGCIRQSTMQPMTVVVPSERMRELLEMWVESL